MVVTAPPVVGATVVGAAGVVVLANREPLGAVVVVDAPPENPATLPSAVVVVTVAGVLVDVLVDS